MEKQSNPDLVAKYNANADAKRLVESQSIYRDLVARAGQNALPWAGGGLLLGGIAGLYQTLRRNAAPPKGSRFSARPVRVPVAVVNKRKKDKQASVGEFVQEKMVDPVVGAGSDLVAAVKGQRATQPWGHPMAVPLAAAPFGVGLGAYALADWIMDKHRESQLDSRASKTQAELEQLLVKRSSDEPDAIDELFDTLQEKQAGDGMRAAENVTGNLAGWYALSALGLGGGSAKIVYDLLRARQPNAQAEKARRSHERMLAARRPAPMLASAASIPASLTQ